MVLIKFDLTWKEILGTFSWAAFIIFKENSLIWKRIWTNNLSLSLFEKNMIISNLKYQFYLLAINIRLYHVILPCKVTYQFISLKKVFLGHLRGLTPRCPREYFHILWLIERFRYQPGLEGEAQICGSHLSVLLVAKI